VVGYPSVPATSKKRNQGVPVRRYSTFALALFLALPVFATTYIVNDAGDGPDQTPGDDVCATAGAVCTLRAAIMEANAHSGNDVIQFSGALTITPATALPAITELVTIRGDLTPGFVNVPLVNVDGSAAGVGAYGLDIAVTAGNSSILAIQIYGFGGAGIRSAASGVAIRRSYLGPITTGSANFSGLEITGGDSIDIGGSNGVGNVISGNQGTGILITGGTNIVIRDNFIGTNAAGTAALGNSTGIDVSGGSGIRIGSDTANAWNVISGNASASRSTRAETRWRGTSSARTSTGRAGWGTAPSACGSVRVRTRSGRRPRAT
jgi:hypothetical protein